MAARSDRAGGPQGSPGCHQGVAGAAGVRQGSRGWGKVGPDRRRIVCTATPVSRCRTVAVHATFARNWRTVAPRRPRGFGGNQRAPPRPPTRRPACLAAVQWSRYRRHGWMVASSGGTSRWAAPPDTGQHFTPGGESTTAGGWF